MKNRLLKSNYKFILIALILITVLITVFILSKTNHSPEIREAAVAGSFYPGNEKELSNMIGRFMEKADYRNINDIKGLVAPHAGYIYSGLTAAQGYKQLSSNLKTVVILAPSHHKRFSGISISNASYYETPLGLVKLSDRAEEIRKKFAAKYLPEVHQKEHSIEVQLPFLQTMLGDFEIIPIVTGNVDAERLADMLIDYIDKDTLIIASTDLSHYYPYETAVEMDKNCIEAIPNINFSKMDKCEACGKIPVLALMNIAKKLNWSSRMIDYSTSFNATKDKKSVVGYTSIAFYKNPFNESEKNFLLKLARKSISSHLNNSQLPVEKVPESLKTVKGCFVTLKKQGALRGCIGHIYPVKPLYQCVKNNAVNAAVNDNRFPPLTIEELDDINIEISVLSKPIKINKHGQELTRFLVKGQHGVVLKQGLKQSTYLPQVWKQISSKEQFLSPLCRKGGMETGCWKSKETEVFVYEDFAFSEGY